MKEAKDIFLILCLSLSSLHVLVYAGHYFHGKSHSYHPYGLGKGYGSSTYGIPVGRVWGYGTKIYHGTQHHSYKPHYNSHKPYYGHQHSYRYYPTKTYKPYHGGGHSHGYHYQTVGHGHGKHGGYGGHGGHGGYGGYGGHGGDSYGKDYGLGGIGIGDLGLSGLKGGYGGHGGGYGKGHGGYGHGGGHGYGGHGDGYGEEGYGDHGYIPKLDLGFLGGYF